MENDQIGKILDLMGNKVEKHTQVYIITARDNHDPKPKFFSKEQMFL